MKFSLINECGTHKNNIRGHSFFEVVLNCEFINIIIVTKQVDVVLPLKTRCPAVITELITHV